MPVGRFWNRSAGQILETEVKHILSDYDVVLIDCPPDMGVVTLNGLRIADGYIIPTIPDVLSSARVAAPKARHAAMTGDIRLTPNGDPRRVVNTALTPSRGVLRTLRAVLLDKRSRGRQPGERPPSTRPGGGRTAGTRSSWLARCHGVGSNAG
ncbi:MAG: chromosome partitioning protein [Thermoleophilaceae bacterium]|nr:chromosome partitioning protein [Thermoleophilaceae bacterium]